MEIMDILRAERLLKEGSERPQERYARVVIDFSLVEFQGTDVKLDVQGDYLAKVKYTGLVGDCTIRVNHRHAQEIPAKEFKKSYAIYNKLYITSTDTSGELILMVGGALSGEFEAEKAEPVGKIYSFEKTTTNEQLALSTPPATVFRSLTIKNTEAANAAVIGNYQVGGVAAFRGEGLTLTAGQSSPMFFDIDAGTIYVVSLVDDAHCSLIAIGVIKK